jgi:2-polyprenyl-6-methoxyphenol hydroxylase-like FAD-dependent oxidoreductase
MPDDGGRDVPQEFDIVCLGGGVAGEAVAVGLQDSGRTLLGTPRKTLADVVHSFSAFNRMLGESLNPLAARVARKGEHHEQYASQH